MSEPGYLLIPIGWVESPLVDRDAAPKQGDEGAPDAWLVFDAAVEEGIGDLAGRRRGHRADLARPARRDVLAVHPRGDRNSPERGVFSTRSPDRPNPIGLHTVLTLSIDGNRIQVRNLEALDGTPIVDVKPVLEPIGQR